MIGIGLGLNRGRGGGFSPNVLFAAGEPGDWIYPRDLSKMWQDVAGTTPVTADGQSVQRIDGQRGLISLRNATNPPIYKTSGGRHFLQWDGVNDSLASAAALDLTGVSAVTVCAKVTKRNTDDFHCLMEFGPDASSTPNTFGLWAPWGTVNNYGFLCRGPSVNNVYQPATYAAPTTNVLTGLFDITGASLATTIIPRVDGVVEQENPTGTGAAGTAFSSQTVNVGARAGGTFAADMDLSFLLIRGAMTTGADLTRLEAFASGT